MKTTTALFTNSRANIPGGAFAEKSRRRSWSGRVKKSGLFASIVLLLCMLIPGCADREGVGFRDFVVDDNRLIDIKMDNAHFELIPSANSQPVQLSKSFWLTGEDQVAVKFDTFELHWERIGAMCAINDNNSTPDCNVCDYCRNSPVPSGPPCFGVTLERDLSTQFDLVVRHEGFIPDPEPQLALSIPSPQILNGCPGSPTSIAFKPETSATYQIIIPKTDLSVMTSPFDVAAETKIHVIEKDVPQTAAYQLNRETVDGTDFWTWEVPGDSNLWLENFSPSLRVTKIRILRGRCEPDPVSGKECVSPSEVVKPSSLLFLPDFRANNPLTVSGFFGLEDHRCFADPNVTNGYYIKLTDLNTQESNDCRTTNDPNPPILERFATPTYESTPPRSLLKLTWLVEFNTSEGADADLTTPAVNDPMPADAELIIEFTIEAT